MPNVGPRPSRKSVEVFLNYTRNKSNIIQADEVRLDIILIQRRKGADIIVKLVDIYTVSQSDIIEQLEADPDVTCIVTTSAWNSYTSAAKAEARSRDVGLFTFKEFMGAVHCVGEAFFSYH